MVWSRVVFQLTWERISNHKESQNPLNSMGRGDCMPSCSSCKSLNHHLLQFMMTPILNLHMTKPGMWAAIDDHLFRPIMTLRAEIRYHWQVCFEIGWYNIGFLYSGLFSPIDDTLMIPYIPNRWSPMPTWKSQDCIFLYSADLSSKNVFVKAKNVLVRRKCICWFSFGWAFSSLAIVLAAKGLSASLNV